MKWNRFFVVNIDAYIGGKEYLEYKGKISMYG